LRCGPRSPEVESAHTGTPAGQRFLKDLNLAATALKIAIETFEKGAESYVVDILPADRHRGDRNGHQGDTPDPFPTKLNLHATSTHINDSTMAVGSPGPVTNSARQQSPKVGVIESHLTLEATAIGVSRHHHFQNGTTMNIAASAKEPLL